MTTRDVLGLREFRLLFAGHGVSVFGDRMVAVALAFAVLEVGGSASEVGLVLAASWVPAVASVLVGGSAASWPRACGRAGRWCRPCRFWRSGRPCRVPA